MERIFKKIKKERNGVGGGSGKKGETSVLRKKITTTEQETMCAKKKKKRLLHGRSRDFLTFHRVGSHGGHVWKNKKGL